MQPSIRRIEIDVAAQRLDLIQDGQVLRRFSVSTAAAGIGTEPGSNQTPPGRLVVDEKIGDGAPLGMVFRSRVPTGEIGAETSPEDLVQTRILWLAGRDPENANTKQRYIYIHGTNHEAQLGKPCSHGCIRMSNADVAELFALVEPGTEVLVRV